MKNRFLPAFILTALLLGSCGPSAEEMKKMQDEAAKTLDSLSVVKEKELAKELEKDSAK